MLHLSDRNLTVLLAHSVSRVVNLSLLVDISLYSSVYICLPFPLSIYRVLLSRSRSRELYLLFPLSLSLVYRGPSR
jgi:hypothetical protein